MHLDAVRFADPDLFVTLYAGREIDARGGPPRVDDVSFATAGLPWVDYEWGARWIFYRMHEAWPGGLVTLRLALAALLVLALGSIGRRHGAGPLRFALAVGALVAVAGSFFLFRPTLFTFALLGVVLALLDRARDGARAPLLVLPPLFWLWVNVHAGFALGIAVVGLAALESVYEAARPGTRPGPHLKVGDAIGSLMGCVASTLANPYGWRIWTSVLGTMGGSLTAELSEWKPIWALGPWHRLDALVLMAASAALLVAVRRRVRLYDLVLVAALGAAAVARVRFVPVFAIAAAATALRLLPGAEAWGIARWPARRGSALAAAGAAGALLLVWALEGNRHALIFKVEPLTPVRAVSFLQGSGIAGDVLTEYDWGGYVRWTLPRARIFVDGRSDTVYPHAVVAEWADFVNARGNWRALADRYRPSAILLRRQQAVVAALEREPGWAPVYADGTAALFVREGGANAAFLAEVRGGRRLAPQVSPAEFVVR